MTAIDRSLPTVLRLRGQDMWWAAWTVAAAFLCYFCTYAFRRPFTAAGFSDTTLWGLGFKTVLVTTQVAGYMVSKFLGIRVIAEMPPGRRAAGILVLVLLAEASLIAFGLVPRPWNAICLFLNGLPLGMVFGLVLGFLEGRRLTELLAAGLCASFILADGVTKSAGAWLLTWGVSEDWMPAVAGALFLVPLMISVAMLRRVPEPNDHDRSARNPRQTMDRAARAEFLRRYAPGLVPLVVMYLAVTVVRSFRADFAPEIWKGLGSPAIPSTFTRSEIWVALGVLVVNGAAVLIADNRRAFFVSLATCGLGLGLLAVALLTQEAGLVASFPFMVLVGLGLYLPYVAVHTTVFERLLGMTSDPGNIGFLMYVADAIGYLGYVAVMLARNFGPEADAPLGFLRMAGWLAVGVSAACLVQAAWYFRGGAGQGEGAGQVESPGLSDRKPRHDARTRRGV